MLFGRSKEPFKFEKQNGEAVLVKYSGKDKAVVLPEQYEGAALTRIGDNAFYDNGHVEHVQLPKGLKAIGMNAFRGCSALKEIALPEGLESIGEYAFAGCKSLASVSLPVGLSLLPSGAFSKCRALCALSLPNSIQQIGDDAFNGCQSLGSVSLGDGLKELGEDVFKGCAKTLCLVLPRQMEYDEKRFAGCDRIYRRAEDGLELLLYAGHDTSIELDDEVNGVPVTAIGERVFYLFAYLESIRLPKYLKRIGPGAFAGCSGLNEISFPESLQVIEKGAFLSCAMREGQRGYTGEDSGLRSITLPAGLKSVGENAFAGCALLGSVQINGADTHLGPACFSMCGLKEFHFPPNTKEIQSALLRGCTALETLTIPEGVKAIWDRAFEGCVSVKQLALPRSLELIGEGAFSNMMQLEEIFIPARVREIANEALAFTPELKQISVDPENRCFKAEDGCLMDASGARLIAFAGAKEGSLSIPGGVKEIVPCAFSLSALKESTLPASVSRIGEWAFRASSLKRLVVQGEDVEVCHGALLDTENVQIEARDDIKQKLLGTMDPDSADEVEE